MTRDTEETEDRIWNLVLANDKDVVRHTNNLISLIRRIPGFPKAERLVARASKKGFCTTWNGDEGLDDSAFNHDERTKRIRSSYQALFSLVCGLNRSDRGNWPGSAGCAALEATIEAVQATQYKHYLGFLHEFLFRHEDQVGELSAAVLEAVLYHVECQKILSGYINSTSRELLDVFGNLQEKIEQSVELANREESPVEVIELDAVRNDSSIETTPLHLNRQLSIEPAPQTSPSPIPASSHRPYSTRAIASRRSNSSRQNTQVAQPEAWSPPAAKKGAWEELLFNIESIFASEDGVLFADVRWNELDEHDKHQCSRHLTAQLHLCAPQKLLNHYQKYMIVDTAEPNQGHKRKRRRRDSETDIAVVDFS